MLRLQRWCNPHRRISHATGPDHEIGLSDNPLLRNKSLCRSIAGGRQGRNDSSSFAASYPWDAADRGGYRDAHSDRAPGQQYSS